MKPATKARFLQDIAERSTTIDPLAAVLNGVFYKDGGDKQLLELNQVEGRWLMEDIDEDQYVFHRIYSPNSYALSNTAQSIIKDLKIKVPDNASNVVFTFLDLMAEDLEYDFGFKIHDTLLNDMLPPHSKATGFIRTIHNDDLVQSYIIGVLANGRLYYIGMTFINSPGLMEYWKDDIEGFLSGNDFTDLDIHIYLDKYRYDVNLLEDVIKSSELRRDLDTRRYDATGDVVWRSPHNYLMGLMQENGSVIESFTNMWYIRFYEE